MLTIQEQLENIENFLLDDQKLENEDTLYAVEMAFVIISNQIKEDKANGTGLSIDFMKKYPLNVPSEGVDPRLLITWGNLLELGNRYIHDYLNIKPAYVFTFCQTTFPIIKNRIQITYDQIHLAEQSPIPIPTGPIIGILSEKSEIEYSSLTNLSKLEEDIPAIVERVTKKQKVATKPDQQRDLLDELEEEYQSKDERQTELYGPN